MAYRIAENDALQKYRQQFDLAQLYTYMAATAYDYETNLRGDDPAAADKLIRRIVGERSLGELRWNTGAWDLDPIVGSGGLADVLGRLRIPGAEGPDGVQQPAVADHALLAAAGAVPAARLVRCSLEGNAPALLPPNIYANP